MYLLRLDYQNAKLNGAGQLSPRKTDSSIAKWTLLDADEQTLELLRLIFLSYNSPGHLKRIPFSFNTLVGDKSAPMLTWNLRILHSATDKSKVKSQLVTGGMQIDTDGTIQKHSQKMGECFHRKFAQNNPKEKLAPGSNFILGYGDDFSLHDCDETHDMKGFLCRTRRYHSLFSANASLIDPAKFLDILFHRGAKYKRLPSMHILDRICRLLFDYDVLDVRHWLHNPSSGEQEWSAIPGSLYRPFRLFLDAVCHAYHAFPKAKTPLDHPGVIILHRPDRYCGDSFFPVFLEIMDDLFPNIQFIVSVIPEKRCLVPHHLLETMLDLPSIQEENAIHPIKNKKVDVLLIDVDGTLPNLALMKLYRFFKEQGRGMMLTRGVTQLRSAREIYASCLFSSRISEGKIQKLQNRYGDSLQLGGSGIDLQKRLPEAIEALAPDYDAYPELADRAIGFLSRGCPMHCPFCLVPVKEGGPRQVSDLVTLLENGRRSKLILLDDNLLSLPHADGLLEEMVSRNIMVNFTQTLDLRFVDRNRAALLRRIHCSNTRFTRSNYYFSLNDNRNLDFLRKKYELFNFTYRDNVEFVCMYGFNTTLAEDVERFRFLKSLWGAYVFTQEYQPIPGGPPPQSDHFFEGDPDRLIDELIHIQFSQNMKSMEKYYRWISRKYAEIFGKLHTPLVDTIFRYNQRHLKGRYIETMAGLKRGIVSG